MCGSIIAVRRRGEFEPVRCGGRRDESAGRLAGVPAGGPLGAEPGAAAAAAVRTLGPKGGK